eukprot:scaffold51486_cov54-Phaeocystis_antarctica.AAC.3
MSSLLALDREFALCRVAKRAYSEVRFAGREGGKAAGDGSARSVRGRAQLQIRGKARGGAHREHVDHVRDAGRVPAQRLIKRARPGKHVPHVRDLGRVEV